MVFKNQHIKRKKDKKKFVMSSCLLLIVPLHCTALHCTALHCTVGAYFHQMEYFNGAKTPAIYQLYTSRNLYLILIFTRVGTYVQRGSKFCFVVVLLLLVGKSLVKLASLAVY
jgi:hypothetical protein